MAQPQRRAEFFVDSRGTAIPKAPPLTESERWAAYDALGLTCVQCGCAVRRGGKEYRTGFGGEHFIASGQIDHIVPRSRGGQNDLTNLRVLCYSCNAAKGSKTQEEWLG